MDSNIIIENKNNYENNYSNVNDNTITNAL